MRVDSHFGGATKIGRNGKDLVGRLPAVDLVLGKSAGRAHRKQFRRDANETCEQQLFTIEFRTEARHRMEQAAREALARAGGITDVGAKVGMQLVEVASASAHPLFRIPARVKLARLKNRAGTL